MNQRDTGGPAFPTEHTDKSGLYDDMTLRDYFAAKAMAAMLPHAMARSVEDVMQIPTAAYTAADAMMKARRA